MIGKDGVFSATTNPFSLFVNSFSFSMCYWQLAKEMSCSMTNEIDSILTQRLLSRHVDLDMHVDTPAQCHAKCSVLLVAALLLVVHLTCKQ